MPAVYYNRPVVEEQTTVQSWKITKLAFKRRFPNSKWVAAKAASMVDVGLADFFEDFNLATFIDLSRDDTVAKVTALSNEIIPETFRLTTEEVATVLNVVPTEEEVYV